MQIHFAHANGIPGSSYRPLLERLAPHSSFALERFGHDPRFPVGDNWACLVDELIGYLQHHASEPVVGVGHSMGALLTFMAACKRPDLFRGVLMLDPPIFWGSAAMVLKVLKRLGQSDRLTPAGKSKFRRQRWESRQQAVDYFASKPLFQFAPDCFAAFCDAALEPDDGKGVRLSFRLDVELGIFRHSPDNLKSYVRPEGIPIKLIYADRSNASFPFMILPFARHFGIELQQITGEHMFPLRQPDLTVQYIREFMATLC